ncbi:MAG: hypothetical protein K2G35_00335 [Duncaniella sp.]|nr:hypothetical protein [Duncaniella sp.]
MASLGFGNTPLISAKNCDNGLKSFVSPNSKQLFGGNILTLNLDGGAGIAYYQPIALDSHVACLSTKIPLTRHQQLFVAMY